MDTTPTRWVFVGSFHGTGAAVVNTPTGTPNGKGGVLNLDNLIKGAGVWRAVISPIQGMEGRIYQRGRTGKPTHELLIHYPKMVGQPIAPGWYRAGVLWLKSPSIGREFLTGHIAAGGVNPARSKLLLSVFPQPGGAWVVKVGIDPDQPTDRPAPAERPF